MNKFQRDNWRKYSLKFTVKDGELFYWRGMTVMIDNWIAECDQCQREGKTLGTVAPLQTIKVSAVWELLGIDLTGPFPKTTDGYQYIFTATDYFSKHGCPKRILSDQGRDFVNELNDSLCSLLGIERSVTAAYHPQTNGLDEKTNHNIKRALMKSKVHISTKHTPFQLMYGREAVFPSEVPVDYPCSRRQSWHFLDPPIKNKWRKNQEAFGGFEEGKNSRFTRTLPNVTATHQWNLRVRRRLTYKQNRAMRVCPIVQRRAK
uniref:Integrase catalytic domain-containing protein n=1 Tax=Knipowitschia caucasica TaxID=637954 RepID=A0AAV2M5D3_KNICA